MHAPLPCTCHAVAILPILSSVHAILILLNCKKNLSMIQCTTLIENLYSRLKHYNVTRFALFSAIYMYGLNFLQCIQPSDYFLLGPFLDKSSSYYFIQFLAVLHTFAKPPDFIFPREKVLRWQNSIGGVRRTTDEILERLT